MIKIPCPHKTCGGSLLPTTKVDDVGVIYVCDNCGEQFYGQWDEVNQKHDSDDIDDYTLASIFDTGDTD